MTRTVRVLEFVVSEFKVCVYSKKSVATPATRKGERKRERDLPVVSPDGFGNRG